MNKVGKIGILMGSDSDLPIMKECAGFLEDMDIPFEIDIISAHRTPDRLIDYAKTAVDRNLSVIIAGAGGAAHLAGVVAALTPLPVIGVPIKSANLNGIDSLLSIVQMPKGIPVATVSINGAFNAGILGAQILAVHNKEIQTKILDYKNELKNGVVEKSEKLKKCGYKDYFQA